MPDVQNLLVLPRLRVQNANAISSPMTWGFPAMSAFVGLMQALERKLPEDLDLQFDQVGVICHDCQAQATEDGFTRAFHLTRNPVDKSGKTAAIVEEGRIHLEITLVFAVQGESCNGDEAGRTAVAEEVAERVHSMRIAGGSVVPPLAGEKRRQKPMLVSLPPESDDRVKAFRQLCRYWLPGFVLVSRDDLLAERFNEMRREDSQVSRLDAWLDLSRLNHECHLDTQTDEHGDIHEHVRWEVRKRPGWIVPIPVGYGALSRLYKPGEVARTRDDTTPFRFVESLYSMGQWVSPHRLKRPEQLLWYVHNDLEAGLYRLNNDFKHDNATV